jgi:hypothetical protein
MPEFTGSGQIQHVEFRFHLQLLLNDDLPSGESAALSCVQTKVPQDKISRHWDRLSAELLRSMKKPRKPKSRLIYSVVVPKGSSH